MSDTRYCTCGHLHGRQDGYTRINNHNDFGCGNCRKPTKMYLEKVIEPREAMSDAGHGHTA